jgi:hypothetical protein
LGKSRKNFSDKQVSKDEQVKQLADYLQAQNQLKYWKAHSSINLMHAIKSLLIKKAFNLNILFFNPVN